MMQDGVQASFAIFLLGVFCVTAFACGQLMVATDCETLGKFRHGGKIYECQVKEPAP